MKKATLFLIAMTLFVVAFAQTPEKEQPKQEGIKWMTWQEAVEAQKTQPKKIFIDIYTDWCGWCKRMDQSTFKDPSVIAYMNATFYAVKMDGEMADTINFNNHTFINPRPKKEGERKGGTHTLPASLMEGNVSYPTFVILDENFSRIDMIKGYKKVQPFLGHLLFFGTNEYIRYNQYVEQQRKAQSKQQQKQTPVPTEAPAPQQATPLVDKPDS